jgi:hypothetical protein
MKTVRSLLCLALVPLCLSATGALAAEPPGLLNYQGVLRDADGSPLEGAHDMVFRFMTAEVGGDEILVDEHDGAHASPVTVTGGLFNVELGGGALSDGSGPGTYTSLDRVFRDYEAVWLEIEVGGETLAPRVRVVSAAYAFNADYLDGINSSALLRSNASDSYTSGTLTMNGATTLDVNGTLRLDGSVTKATTDHVANFNADLLDGMDSSEFADSVHSHPGSDITSPVGEAVNADTVDGKHASAFLDTSSTAQTKAGPLTVDASGAAVFGIEATGQTGGGHFEDSNNSGYARAAWGNFGMYARGSQYGAKFEDSDDTGFAYLGYENHGVSAGGSVMGGRFEDSESTGLAFLGYGDTGVWGEGESQGGYFKDKSNSGQAWAGRGDIGIEASGSLTGGQFYDSEESGFANVGWYHYGILAHGDAAGGSFSDGDGTGHAYVGYDNTGIRAQGSEQGGYFLQSDYTSYARVAYLDEGIQATGDWVGGYFQDGNESGYALVAYEDNGIRAFGNSAGGHFRDLNGTGYADVGYGNWGISAHGSGRGGAFYDTDGTSYAYIANYNTGTESYGNQQGGYFQDLTESTYSRVGYSTYKIYSSGTNAFVQNHPDDPSRVVVYHSPEASEVAVYTRGSDRLEDGTAHITLDTSFQWVANPDLGLTAHLTPRGAPCLLHIVGLTTDTLSVGAEDPDCSDAEFDYMVWGLRIGFEELPPVQPKTEEAYIPSMRPHHDLYAQHPELRGYNALERFKGMTAEVRGTETAELDFSASTALRAAIQEYAPEIHGIPGVATSEELDPDRAPSAAEATPGAVTRAGGGRASTSDGAVLGGVGNASGSLPRTAPIDEEGNVYGRSFRPSATDLASLVEVTEPVEPGDVLVIDPEQAGRMSLARRAADSAVFGIVAAEPGVVLGSDPVTEVAAAPAVGLGAGAAVESPSVAEGSSRVPVAVSGMVLCKVDAGYGSIRPGDLLTTSPTPGHAMLVHEPAAGTILGKALEGLDTGTGTIRVLVMLR